MELGSKSIKTLEIIQKLNNLNLSVDESMDVILDNLSNLTGFSKALVCYLESSGLVIKNSRGFDFTPDEFIKLNEHDLKKLLNSNETGIFDTNIPVKQIDFCLKKPYNYLVSPLKLRSNLFGLILLFKENGEVFSPDDFSLIDTLSAVIAYAVKDAELEGIFKAQLKALKTAIDDKNKAYEIIKEQNEKILEADRVKNEFLANTSHELRTPLNAIIGFSEALSLKLFGDLNPKQEEYVNDIHNSGVHLLGMINDILDLAKLESRAMKVNKSTINPHQSIKEAINVVSPLADKKNIMLNFETFRENTTIFADKQKFNQIMYNLLSNAIKFTNENGFIEIGYSFIEDNIRIFVKDNGIGIDKKHHNSVFDKFQQVDSSYTRKQSSTGLGLTITKELVELHNGKIWVDSELNEGSTFVFELPIGEQNENHIYC